MPSYGIAANDYLRRAREQLDREEPGAMFYAAFELRCGIEQRMREYLEVQEHIAEKKKEGWRVPKLARSIEEAFGIGDKIVRIRIGEDRSSEPMADLYYTPVTERLQSMAGRLGNYLHAQRGFKESEDEWWEETRDFLEEVYGELYRACQGSLLGPPLVSPEGKMRMPMEADTKANQLADIGVGQRFELEVMYLDNYPEALERTT